MRAKTHATIEDLYKVEGKAELMNGEIIEIPLAGDDPGYASGEIFAVLRGYVRRTKWGRAYGDGVGFHVHLPHREAFSPDAAYHVGPRTGKRFLEGAPIFAVEVRSENDYGPAVDLLSDDVIKVYRASDPDHPTIYRRGEMAEAEPAVPGWRCLSTICLGERYRCLRDACQ
jgi:Uma2 family endonuclease